MKKTIWLDMDGVMVVYDRLAYRGENPVFMQAGSHYYRNVVCDEFIKKLAKALSDNEDCTVYIITKVSSLYNLRWEQVNDKKEWIKEHFPFVPEENFYSTIGSKSQMANAVLWGREGRPLSDTDILIDDFNENLLDWVNGGGTSVKYLNGLNDPNSFDGTALTNEMCISDAVGMLLNYK